MTWTHWAPKRAAAYVGRVAYIATEKPDDDSGPAGAVYLDVVFRPDPYAAGFVVAYTECATMDEAKLRAEAHAAGMLERGMSA